MTALVCWQPVLTDHQRHTLDALGRALGTAPVYIVAARSLAARDRQGWTQVDAPLTAMPRHGLRRWVAAMLAAYPQAVHIFGSPFGDRRVRSALLRALRADACVWLVSEPWADVGESYFADRPVGRDRAKAWLRPLLYRLYGHFIRRRVAGVFAISPLAVAQYQAIGIPPDRVVPFGYFVPGPTTAPLLPAPSPTLRVVFVGALIARKGVAELAAAADLLAVRGVPVAIDVFGPGKVPVSALRYRGTIMFGEASRVIAGYDLLVVPSRHDGWAVVVNEALTAGVPVAASDRVGAGAMIDRWGCGTRFRAGDAAALADVLERIATDPSALATMRAAARTLAPQLTPERAAAYMAAAIQGRPQANPWY